MDETQNFLYVMFSATPYRMGRWIRFVTQEPYNHVSISTDESLDELYAFARRYYRTPFYGGFVTESPCRYYHRGSAAQILLCRLPLNQAQWNHLCGRINKMRADPRRYIYNHLSALTAPFHRKVRVPDAYTCAEFTVSILQELGFDFRSDRFYSIDDIVKRLSPYQVYTGEFPAEGASDADFFERRPVSHPIIRSARDFFKLLWRKAIA